jgi:hypothetical protein
LKIRPSKTKAKLDSEPASGLVEATLKEVVLAYNYKLVQQQSGSRQK